jgi:hypothetical protein
MIWSITVELVQSPDKKAIPCSGSESRWYVDPFSGSNYCTVLQACKMQQVLLTVNNNGDIVFLLIIFYFFALSVREIKWMSKSILFCSVNEYY